MSFVPYVVEQTSKGERSYDIYSRLLKEKDKDKVKVKDKDKVQPQALGSSGGSGDFFDDDFFNIFKRLGGEGIDKVYDVYPETGGDLIQEVFEDVKAKRKEVKDPVAYVLGYAKKVGWSDET